MKSLNQFLQLLIAGPEFPELVEALTVNWYRWKKLHDDPMPQVVMTGHTSFVEEAEKRAFPPDCATQLRQYHPRAYILLLLHLLPSLQKLVIRTDYEFDDSDFDFHLSEYIKMGYISASLKLFIRDSLQKVDTDYLMPIFLLPSMKEIEVVTPWGQPMLPQVHQYGSSNVEHLSLFDSEVHLDTLTELLRLPRKLKSLIYHGSIELFTYGPDNPDRFKSVLDLLAATLHRLELTWSGSEGWSGEFTVWSFSQFIHLVSLRIDYFLLYGNDPATAPCIAHSLPPALVDLIMHRTKSWKEQDCIEIWRELLIKKSSTCLSRLQLVGHDMHWELLQSLVDLATSRNIKIAMSHTDLYCTWRQLNVFRCS